jgi:hypothetical protein
MQLFLGIGLKFQSPWAATGIRDSLQPRWHQIRQVEQLHGIEVGPFSTEARSLTDLDAIGHAEIGRREGNGRPSPRLNSPDHMAQKSRSAKYAWIHTCHMRFSRIFFSLHSSSNHECIITEAQNGLDQTNLAPSPIRALEFWNQRFLSSTGRFCFDRNSFLDCVVGPCDEFAKGVIGKAEREVPHDIEPLLNSAFGHDPSPGACPPRLPKCCRALPIAKINGILKFTTK